MNTSSSGFKEYNQLATLVPSYVESFFFKVKPPKNTKLSDIEPSPMDSRNIWYLKKRDLYIIVLSDCGMDKNKIYIGAHSPGSNLYR